MNLIDSVQDAVQEAQRNVQRTTERWARQNRRQRRMQSVRKQLRSAENARPLLIFGALGALLAFRYLQRRMPTYSLQGKVVLVTGGGRGLGLALAREVGSQGARVVICGRTPETLARAEQDLRSRGIDALALVCDVTDQNAVTDLIDQVIAQFGGLDVLINNAGAILVGPMDAMTPDDYALTMNTHFWGPLYTMTAALPHLSQRKGRIVNISSIGGKVTMPHLTPYSVSKFALGGLSQGARAEYAPHGVTVTAVYPGPLRTGGHHHSLYKGKHSEEFAWFTLIDTLPVTSVDAAAAAREIIRAMRHGDSQVVVGPLAQTRYLLIRLFPKAVSAFMEAIDRLLPRMGGIGKQVATGLESYSPAAPSSLTALGEQAAIDYNQFPKDDAPFVLSRTWWLVGARESAAQDVTGAETLSAATEGSDRNSSM
jgi:NAD(P)-dependent dehydrogenase (short-subunit alcohol dehydrogenase family)